MDHNESLSALYQMAEAYAFGRAHGTTIVVPEIFAQAYIDTWKTWQEETGSSIAFMFPDDFYKLYVGQI